MHQEIITLDVRGEVCPYPLILSLKKYEKIKEDVQSGKKILEIITDCPSSVANVPTEYEKRGLKAEVEKMDKRVWKIIIKNLKKKVHFVKLKALNLTRLTMGIIILTGLLFFRPLAYLAGIMMIFAGLTNICLLEIFWSKLLGPVHKPCKNIEGLKIIDNKEQSFRGDK